ncbi:CHAT domain-containing protein [Microbacterium sp. 2MCAF23]|uniref:CHAT domain-containing protein n=1 Tax=Microbacterium sp. 2MCAF23 TaxID=3232985 RepID=UPI003F9EAA15
MPGERVTAGDVADGAPERPCVQVKFADVGDLYVTWRWEHALERPRAYAIPRAAVQPVLDRLDESMPSPRHGESVVEALDRAFRGPLADPDRERRLSAELAGALLPAPLAAELNAMLLRDRRPHLRIQGSPSLGRVPWEALFVDTDRRMVHEAEVSLLVPAGVRNAPSRRVSPWDPHGPVVAILDPPVPGGMLAPVLGPTGTGQALAALQERLGSRARGAEPLLGGAIDRVRLRALLADASRFLYVGHVSSSDHGLDVRMHLSDGPALAGRAALLGAHRPLTAADIAYGAPEDAGDDGWRIPARVALMACESGGDTGFAEPTALVAALVRGGAEHVAAARWALPTDAGFARAAGADAPAFSAAVDAVDATQESADPVAALNAWQRASAETWARSGAVEHSPLMWAAISTTWSPPRRDR